MASVVLFAVGGAALRSASPLWASIIFSLTLGILATAVLGSLFSRRSRPFWSGFVLFGWGYMTLVFGPWFKNQIHSHLFTTRIVASTADHFLDATKFEPEIIAVFPAVPIAHQAFYHIAHSLFTLLSRWPELF
jgi:hypothetical protein